MRIAKYLGVAPWDLADHPEWYQAGIVASNVDAQLEHWARGKHKKQAMQKN